MLNMDEVDRIATEAAQATLMGSIVARVESSEIVDSSNEDALHVLVVLSDQGPVFRGDGVLEMLARVQRELRRRGDDRFAYVHYATEAEMREDASADP